MGRVYTGINCRGGFSCPEGMFFMEGSDLKKFSNGMATLVRGGFYGAWNAYLELDDVVYFSDGNTSIRIVNGVAKDWGISTPPSPLLSPASGTLGAGTYLGAIAWVMADGRQSALSDIRNIDIADNGGVTFTNLPGSPTGMIETPAGLRLFLSTPNGDILFRVTDLALGSISPFTVNLQGFDSGMEEIWRPLGPPPGGRIIKYHNGRIYMADDTGIVYYSNPQSYHLFDLASDWLQFSDPVTMMEPTDQGIFFGFEDKVEFHRGADPEEGFNKEEKMEYGALFGSSRRLGFDPASGVVWQSSRGTVMGGADGSCRNISEGKVAMDTGTSAATLIREDEGRKQYLASIAGGQPNVLAASSWITAEVFRRS